MNGDWFEFIVRLGSIAGALTGVSKVSIAIYNKTVIEPQNRLTERIQAENGKQIANSLNPLTEAIDKLNYLLEESQRDRKDLHEKTRVNKSRIAVHEKELGQHDKRIAVLEDRCDVRKKVD